MSGRAHAVRLVGIVLLIGAALAGSAKADLADGLVGHWEFEGDFADSAGNNDATAAGDAIIVSDAVRDAVVEFDGDGDYLEIANSPSLNMTGNEITLAAWVYFDDVSGPPEIIIAKVFNNTTHQSPYFSYGLHILTNGQPRMWISRSGGTSNAPGTTNLQSGQWYHLAGVYDGSQMRLYLDAEVVATNNVSGNLVGYDTVLRLGINGGRTEPMDGKLDDVRIYNRALSDREIASLVTGVSLYTAWKPIPADGDPAVSAPLLQWSPGETAFAHDVYLGTDPNLGPDDLVQARNPMMLYYHGAGFAPGTSYYWRVDEIEADGTTVHTGDVWSFVAQDETAYRPDPADGATDGSADPNAALTWLPGIGAIDYHIYFGANFADVNEASAEADKGPVTEPVFSPGALAPLTTYYWRVDELKLDGAVRAGAVWSFTTYAVVDDFESYTNQVGARVFEVWTDGIGFTQPEPGDPGNGTGAAVGHDIWSPDSPHFEATIGETGIVHGDDQSMPLYYDNESEPHYSQTERVWAAPQDWLAGGAAMLVLHVRGSATNAPEPLYVTLEDSAQSVAVVVHPDAEVTTAGEWARWDIPLATFGDAGVNLAAVKAMYIGLGDRNAPTAGGAGLIYVDDVWLTR